MTTYAYYFDLFFCLKHWEAGLNEASWKLFRGLDRLGAKVVTTAYRRFVLMWF